MLMLPRARRPAVQEDGGDILYEVTAVPSPCMPQIPTHPPSPRRPCPSSRLLHITPGIVSPFLPPFPNPTRCLAIDDFIARFCPQGFENGIVLLKLMVTPLPRFTCLHGFTAMHIHTSMQTHIHTSMQSHIHTSMQLHGYRAHLHIRIPYMHADVAITEPFANTLTRETFRYGIKACVHMCCSWVFWRTGVARFVAWPGSSSRWCRCLCRDTIAQMCPCITHGGILGREHAPTAPVQFSRLRTAWSPC